MNSEKRSSPAPLVECGHSGDVSRRTGLCRIGASLLVALAASFAGHASAQSYPSKNITLIVPFNAGSSLDIVARDMAVIVGNKLGRAVIVENKPGAGTLVASRFVASAAPDGYTLFLSSSSSALAPEMNPAVTDKFFVRDMAHVGPLAVVPNLIVVSGELPVRNIGEFIAYMRAHPGKVSYATPGTGSSPHLQGELFKMMTKTDMVHVPYKGMEPVYADLATGRVHMTIVPYGAVKAYVDTGKMKILAVTTPDRHPLLPEVPTVAESGVPGFSVVPWVGISAPKGTPAAIINTLNQILQEAAMDASFQARLKSLYLLPMRSSPAEFQAFVNRDVDRWAKIIKETQIKID